MENKSLLKNITKIKNICDELGITISVSESLTSGKIQDLLASVSGSSTYFQGGVTVYNIDKKVALLGVDREHADSVNCVSQRVADEMADGCLKLFLTDISISVTGYAEPNEEVERPFCYFCIKHGGDILENGKIESQKTFFTDSEEEFRRNPNRTVFTNIIVNRLLENLKKI